MENRQIKVNATNDATKGLIEAAFTQIALLGSAEQASRLFPEGIGMLELQVALGNDTQRDVSLSLRIAGQQSTPTAAPLAVIAAEGDVEATFNAEGHHIVAFILESDLNQNDPDTMQRVQEILDRGHRDLEHAATFPDDIRSAHPETKPFHFIDIPFEQGGPVNPPLPQVPNVITKIAEFSHKLKNGGTDQEKVDALSWLIHLFGDIHQPLHCIERISQLHPGGDRGGNSFRLGGGAENLHKFWDSSANFHNGVQQQVAEKIMVAFPRSELADDLENTNVESWARASFALAKKYAYGPLHENPAHPPTPSATYLKRAEKIGRRQAALAAYRLADRLRAILA
jgi:hypothetical protein